MKHILALTLTFGFALLPSIINAAAAPDPDRDSTTPTGWTWYFNRSAAELEDIRNDGNRIIDLEISPTTRGTFDAVLVPNAGVYQRVDGWWNGFTAQQVIDKVAEKNGRITDLEPYTVNGQRRFHFALIRNEGEASKFWWWNYDRTVQQVTDEINLHGIRLVDLDAYVVNGQTYYSYVGIGNKGVDYKDWWWYPNVSFDYVTNRLQVNNARLIDLEVHPNGNLSVIMVKNDGAQWWWGAGMTYEQVVDLFSLTASRIIDLESYLVNGVRQYAAITIDNANAETKRLRNLIGKCYDGPSFGNNEIRGFLVKQVGGPVYADLAGALPFQPLSTLKLLPYLYTMMEIDKGNASLNSILDWTEFTTDNAKTPFDDTKYADCLSRGDPETKTGSAKFSDALPTMMWESHNRTLNGFLDKWYPTNLTQRAHDLGMNDTEMYYGCKTAANSAPWASNRSTLYDLARIFEGVDQMEFVTKASTRHAFFDNLINIDYDGASYTSPITGAKVGPFKNSFLKEIVEREAGPLKQGIVDEFLQHVVLRGKGGSGGPSGTEMGYSDYLHVTLPFKQNNQIVLKTFTAGWFIYKLVTPTNCPVYMNNGPCEAIWGPEWTDRNLFQREIHTIPIRLALATWPSPTISVKVLLSRDGATFSWPAIAGQRYRVQYKPSLDSRAWTDLDGDILATGATASKSDGISRDASQRFYRVMLVTDEPTRQ